MAQGIKAMILETNTITKAHICSQWFFSLPVILFSLVVLAENSARLDILPTDDDDRLTEEIYNSTTGWRTPAVPENEWRQETRQPASRIQFGYDSDYEEMRTYGNNYGSGTASGGVDHPQNTQLRISF
jgi:hypothetical protein